MLKSSSYFSDDNEFLVRLAIAVHKLRLSGPKPCAQFLQLGLEVGD